MKVLQELAPGFQNMKIHESSPSGSGFKYFKSHCSDYTYSYFYEEWPLGIPLENGGSNQNLEKLTFPDNSFDIFITQDVMEHVMNPRDAFQNIERVLKSGGMHIFTVPLYPFIKTRPRVRVTGGGYEPILSEVYHGNPIDEKGALVTYEWGGDFIDYINSYTDMETEIIEFRNSEQNFKNGLEGNFLQVVISRKR